MVGKLQFFYKQGQFILLLTSVQFVFLMLVSNSLLFPEARASSLSGGRHQRCLIPHASACHSDMKVISSPIMILTSNVLSHGWCSTGLCCHPGGPPLTGEMGWQEPHAAHQGQVQSPAPGEQQPPAPASMCWGPPSWKAAWQKRIWGSWWTPIWTGASNVPLLKRRLVVSWAVDLLHSC